MIFGTHKYHGKTLKILVLIIIPQGNFEVCLRYNNDPIPNFTFERNELGLTAYIFA